MFFSNTAQLFLESVGRHQEVEHYLRRFRTEGDSVFALIVPDAATCREAGDLLRFHLKYLSRLELRPAVLLAGCASDLAPAFEAALGHDERIAIRREDRPLLPALQEYLASGGRRIHLLRSRGRLEWAGGPLALCVPDQEVVPADRAILDLCHGLLETQREAHISVCSPADLLREIFTIKGAGTLFRRPAAIQHVRRMHGTDRDRMLALIEESFGKRLRNGAFLDRVTDFFYEEGFQGAILFEQGKVGMYLSKFAVGVDARGSGIAQDLWDAALAACPMLYWRARRSNSIHRWYERIADGFHRQGAWNVYWKGIAVNDLPLVIQDAMARPPDFVEGESH